jgi:hypothetical protein
MHAKTIETLKRAPPRSGPIERFVRRVIERHGLSCASLPHMPAGKLRADGRDE